MARQKMGQHFLGDAGWRKRILENLRLQPGQTWVEIGPGHGEMTRMLAGDGRRVIAIEADRVLAHGLETEINGAPEEWKGVEVVTSDVLVADVGAIVDGATADAAHAAGGGGTFSVYGSLPYYITSPILHHLFRWAERIASIHIVIQLEVAERIAARPGSRDYGYLSTVCQFYARPKIAFRIPPGAFRPPPKVQSALVEMALPGEGAALGIREPDKFFGFLSLCFTQKRKTLRNNLLGVTSDERIHEALEQTGVRSDARAEQLTLAQFAAIFKSISS
jgi:16S rRNA (adenine1518-N6/adenine1519-N6)-dimethyltransferase